MIGRAVPSLSLTNLLTNEGKADPFPLYRQLQQEHPVHWDREMHCWVLTRYDDVVQVLRDARFSAQRSSVDQIAWLTPNQSSWLEAVGNVLSRQIVFLDPPDHSRLRSLVNRAFSPRAVERLRSLAQEVVDETLDRAHRRGGLDVVRDLAYPLPLTVIADMLGIPSEDQEKFRVWSDDLGWLLGMAPLSRKETIARLRGVAEFATYLTKAARQRRAAPREDLLQELVNAYSDGAISQDDLIGNCILLVAAGHGTTTSLIGNGTAALLDHPDQLALLRSEPSKIDSLVSELLRYVSPIQGVVRHTTEDVVIGDTGIARGSYVYLALAAANRDPARFDDPDRLKLDRASAHNIAFGHGIHYCLGAALAQIESQVAISSLVDRFPFMSLAGPATDWESNIVFRRLRSLPVDLDGRARSEHSVDTQSSPPAYSYCVVGEGESNRFETMTFPAYRALLRSEQRSRSWAAVGTFAGSAPAGLALAEIFEPFAAIRSVYVDPAHRRRGIATRMLADLEQLLRTRGCETVGAVYMTGKSSTSAVERLLSIRQFPPAETRSVVAKLTAEAMTSMPWTKWAELPPDFTIFPWVEMTEEDEQYIAASQESETWIPEELFPSLYHIDFNARASLGLKYQPGFDPETSLGLRYRGHIVGWLIGHRLDSATLRFSSVWVRQDLQRVGRFVPLIGLVVEGGKRAAASGVERVIWLTSVEHPEMVRFTQKWVAPYAAFYGETRGTTKSISP